MHCHRIGLAALIVCLAIGFIDGIHMSPIIRHDRGAHRFSTQVDGAHCELDYTLAADVMTITHTGVPPEVGGRGIAAALVQEALATARREGWRVVPACSYAAVWLGRHPEYRDLVARGS